MNELVCAGCSHSVRNSVRGLSCKIRPAREAGPDVDTCDDFITPRENCDKCERKFECSDSVFYKVEHED